MIFLLIIAVVVLGTALWVLITWNAEAELKKRQSEAGMRVYGKGISGTNDPVLLVRCNYCGNEDIVIHKEQKVAACWKCNNHTTDLSFRDIA